MATLREISSYLCKKYGKSVVSYLYNSNGNIVPKCYVHFSTNKIFTRDKKKANKYIYFELLSM